MANGSLNIETNRLIDHISNQQRGNPVDDSIQRAIEEDEILKDIAEGAEFFLSENEGDAEMLKELLEASRSRFIGALQTAAPVKKEPLKGRDFLNSLNILLILIFSFVFTTKTGGGSNGTVPGEMPSPRELPVGIPELVRPAEPALPKEVPVVATRTNGDIKTDEHSMGIDVPSSHDSGVPSGQVPPDLPEKKDSTRLLPPIAHMDLLPIGPIILASGNAEPDVPIPVLERTCSQNHSVSLFEVESKGTEGIVLSRDTEIVNYEDLKASPNPFSHSLRIGCAIPEDVRQVQITVSHVITKKTVEKKTIGNDSFSQADMEFNFNTSDWPRGAYVVNIKFDNRPAMTKKIVKS